MGLRALRIAGFAAGLAILFHLSRAAGRALNNEEAPGLLVAIAIVSLLFSVRAVVTEKTMGPQANRTKDFLWGISLGGWGTILYRLLTDR
jgi:hypothetical protein